MIITILYSAPLSAPTLLSNNVIDSRTIELSWTPPKPSDHNGIIREYHIKIYESETETEYYHVTSSISLIISSFHPDYTYEWSVAAVTVSMGPYSYALNVTTPEDCKCV